MDLPFLKTQGRFEVAGKSIYLKENVLHNPNEGHFQPISRIYLAN